MSIQGDAESVDFGAFAPVTPGGGGGKNCGIS